MGSLSENPRAGIIGAGIAGLTTAVALRRAGWKCTLYERSKFKNELGAALFVNPPATKCFDRWGLDYARAQPTDNTTFITTKADDLTVLGHEVYENSQELYGAKALIFHRVDLHRELLQMSTGSEGPGPAASLQLGRAATKLDFDEGVIRFEDGGEVQYDLVVVANGVHGNLFTGPDGEENVAKPCGRSSFRFLLPMDRVLAVPELREIYSDGRTGMRVSIDFKDGAMFVNYACRAQKLLNCVVPHRTRDDQDESDAWNAQGSRSQLKDATRNFHPTLQKYFDLCEDEDIKIHHMMVRDPLHSFVHGRACVIGDAAHAMLPTHGAGAGVTIESAATLEPLLAGVKPGDGDTIKQRLQIWNKLRVGRCNFVLLMSNAGVGGLNVPGVEKSIRDYYDGPLPPKEALTWSTESRAVFFDCDPYDEGVRALNRSE